MPNRLLSCPPPGPRVAARGDTPSYRTPMRYPEIPMRRNKNLSIPSRSLFYTPPPGPRVAAQGDTPSYRTPMRYPGIPIRRNISILSKWSTHVLEIKNLSIPGRILSYKAESRKTNSLDFYTDTNFPKIHIGICEKESSILTFIFSYLCQNRTFYFVYK